MIRNALMVLSLVATVAFPWQFAAVLVFASSLYVPYLGIAFGILYDALYYAGGVPAATLVGLAITIIAYFARRFLKSYVSDFSYV